jgi:type I restriction enzyme S subunit
MSNYPIMWKEEKLSNLSTLITKGATPTTYGHDYVHSLTEGGARFVRGNNATISGKFKGSDVKYICHTANEQLKRSKLKVGDIVISIVGSVGTSFQVDKRIIPANINQNVALIRPSNELNSDYLGQVIVSEIVQDIIATELTVQAQPSLSLKQIGDFTIPFPPFPEQQKIAQILTSVDEVIEKTQAQIDKLKDLKTAMMQELLTRGIGHLEFKDSAVGRIPVGWGLTTLGEIGKWKGGGTPSKANKNYWCGQIPWVSPKDMKVEYISKTQDSISMEAILGSSTNLVEKGSLLIVVRSGILQHTLPVAIANCDLTINQDMKALTLSSGFCALYVYHYLLANNHSVLRATLKAGNTVESIDFAAFSIYQIPSPPLIEQVEIANAVESVANNIRKKELTLISNKNTKKALMQDLLTGKVRVNINNN